MMHGSRHEALSQLKRASISDRIALGPVFTSEVSSFLMPVNSSTT